MKIEKLMIESVKCFTKYMKECEIRSICPLEASGSGNNYEYCAFGIQYVPFNYDVEESYSRMVIEAHCINGKIKTVINSDFKY